MQKQKQAGLDIMQRHLASGPAAHIDPRVAAAAAEQQQQQQRQAQPASPARDGDGKGKR